MEWKYTKHSLPLTYITGNFDGKNSDQVLVETESGKKHLAHFNDGFMDGSSFADWYDDRDFMIDEKIKRWIEIPY